MLAEDPTSKDGAAEGLLRRALLDDSSAVAVSLRVDGLPVSVAVRHLPRSARPRHAADVCHVREPWGGRDRRRA